MLLLRALLYASIVLLIGELGDIFFFGFSMFENDHGVAYTSP